MNLPATVQSAKVRIAATVAVVVCALALAGYFAFADRPGRVREVSLSNLENLHAGMKLEHVDDVLGNNRVIVWGSQGQNFIIPGEEGPMNHVHWRGEGVLAAVVFKNGFVVSWNYVGQSRRTGFVVCEDTIVTRFVRWCRR